jgi:hypothetical protein
VLSWSPAAAASDAAAAALVHSVLMFVKQGLPSTDTEAALLSMLLLLLSMLLLVLLLLSMLLLVLLLLSMLLLVLLPGASCCTCAMPKTAGAQSCTKPLSAVQMPKQSPI